MGLFPIPAIGPCEVVWGYGESGALYLGETLGGVKLAMDTSVRDIKTDQAGDAAVDAAYGGSTLTLEINLTRPSMEAINEVLLAGGVLTSGDHQYLPIKNAIGCAIYDLAKAIVLKPICGDVSSVDPAEWIELYKCYPIPAFSLSFDPATQKVFPIKFKIFPSQESGFEGEFGTIGMESGSTEFGL
jgi:hypothetical protein